MFTIPMIHTVQNKGTSIQKLYNRGMLTDEFFDNVSTFRYMYSI
jgi:hypothetical protein